MTVFAGIFDRTGAAIAPRQAQALGAALSRHPGDRPQLIEAPGLVLAKLDIGLLDGPALADDARGSAVAVGEPLLSPVVGTPRQQDLVALWQGWLAGDLSAFSQTRGTFAAAFHDRAGQRLCLFTDRVGVRSLYWAAVGDLVVFATALRVIEALDVVPKALDHAALHEQVSMGFALGDRTPYAHVRMVRGGEAVVADTAGVRVEPYFEWDRLADDQAVTPDAVDALYQTFQQAIALRLKQDTAARAMMSGGLDSRTIVTDLARRGLKLRTLTFTYDRSLDARIAGLYAAAVGADHHAEPVPRPIPYDIGHHVKAYLDREIAFRDLPGARPGLVWAGDGGSVCLGYVNSTPEILTALRAGNAAEAARIHLKRKFVVLRGALLSAQERARFSNHFEQALTAELQRYRGRDAGRALHWFLLTTQERHQVAEHYENIDVRRFEYLLPLFDAELVAAFQRFPLDDCVGHKLYDQWMDRFPPVIRSVAWQAYAGHVQPTQPLPEGDIQWKPLDAAYHRQLRENALNAYAVARRVAPRRPPFVRAGAEIAAYWMTRLGQDKLAYLLSAAASYRRWWAGHGA